MATEPLLPDVRHLQEADRGAFVIERDGERLAEMTYAGSAGGTVTVDHTHVSDDLRGQGVAKRLVDASVQWARASGTRIIPTCSYARAVFERHADLQDVLA